MDYLLPKPPLVVLATIEPQAGLNFFRIAPIRPAAAAPSDTAINTTCRRNQAPIMSALDRFKLAIMVSCAAIAITSRAVTFEGRIRAVMTRGSLTDGLLYTVSPNSLRVEIATTNWPHPVDILNRNSGELTLLFPNNRSFVRLLPDARNSAGPPGFPQMPAVPNLPAGVVQPTAPGGPAVPTAVGGMPAMPMMPPPRMENIDLHDMGIKTNLLGYGCELYRIKQFGETMMVWATDQLLPFQPYLKNQPHHFRPQRLEERWGDLVKAHNLFPLLATLKFDNGIERLRFEVTSVAPQALSNDETNCFETPPEYVEIQPLPY